MTINTNINQCSHFYSLSLLSINPASNMANFLFYRYRFVPVEEVDMFMKQDESVEPSQYDEVHNPRFSEDLSTKASGIKKLNLFQFKKDRKGVQTSVQYENDVLNYNSGVMMLQVRNNKHKKVIPIDKLDALDIPHYPYTLVIVDTRPDSQAILIQQKTSAFKNTEEVAKLVAEYCSRELKLPELGVAMCPQMRVCKGSIWDIVTMRTMKGQDRVKSFTLKLDKKRPNTKNEVDKALQLVLEMFCAPEGELKLSSKKEGAAIFDETREDMRNVVDMLIQNKYHMKVGFEKSGTVEYGKETPAIYGIDDNVCLEFMKGEPHIGSGELGEYYLFDWLDMLMPEGSGYSYKQPQKKKRNGKRN